MDEVTYPPMENLMGLDLRLLAGRPPRYDPDFVLENAVAFKASEGLPAALMMFERPLLVALRCNPEPTDRSGCCASDKGVAVLLRFD